MNIKLGKTPGTAGRSKRGFTMPEVLIAIGIMGVMLVSIASLQYMSALTTKEVYGETRTRASRMRALDQIRYRLCNARVNSVSLSEEDDAYGGYHYIEFVDPNLGGPTSSFQFNPADRTLLYDDDVDDAGDAVKVLTGPINISFDLNDEMKEGLVVLKVKSSAAVKRGDVDIQDGETIVCLRNPSS